MKYRLLFLLFISCAACSLSIAEETKTALSNEVLLPGLKHPLSGGMSQASIVEGLPKADDFNWERLSNGAAFSFVKLEYPLGFLSVNDKLVELWVENIEPKSEIGKWFAQHIDSLPSEHTKHTSRTYYTAGKPNGLEEEWATETLIWSRTPGVETGNLDYHLLFPIETHELEGGMIVRDDPLWKEVSQDSIPENAKRVFPQPLKDHAPQPEFPNEAKKFGVSGKVVVQAYVDSTGHIGRWKFKKIEPIGGGFAQAVYDCVRKWKFKPATIDNKPTGMWIAIPFNFKTK